MKPLFTCPTSVDDLDQQNPLIIIAKAIGWDLLERQLSNLFNDNIGRPALPIRLMAGLLLLQRIYLSDGQTANNCRENIYIQAFTVGTRFSMASPCIRP
ncbi:MAG: transposase [Deltaproteobacteria bacterium]|nr:transposase [Deltaproteobacteria bacterium]